MRLPPRPSPCQTGGRRCQAGQKLRTSAPAISPRHGEDLLDGGDRYVPGSAVSFRKGIRHQGRIALKGLMTCASMTELQASWLEARRPGIEVRGALVFARLSWLALSSSLLRCAQVYIVSRTAHGRSNSIAPEGRGHYPVFP
jgi:hypothetical protein